MLFVGLVSVTVTQLKKRQKSAGFHQSDSIPCKLSCLCCLPTIHPLPIHPTLPYLCHARGYNVLCHVFLTCLCHVPEIKTTRQKRSPNRPDPSKPILDHD